MEAGDEVPGGGRDVGEVPAGGEDGVEATAGGEAGLEDPVLSEAAAEAGADVWRASRRSRAAFHRVVTSPSIWRTLEYLSSLQESHSSVMASVTLSTVG